MLNLNNRRLVRLKVHVICITKKSCTEKNPTKSFNFLVTSHFKKQLHDELSISNLRLYYCFITLKFYMLKFPIGGGGGALI